MTQYNHDFIKDVTDFIFLSDAPEQADVIFIPGGSYPALPEYAARLWRGGSLSRAAGG